MSDKKFGLLVCSCIGFFRPDLGFVHYILTDIVTKKSVKMISEMYDECAPDDIVDATLNMIMDKNNIPGTIFFAGYYYPVGNDIMLELMPVPPLMNALSGSSFACSIDVCDGERIFRDVNTNKEVIIENVDSIPTLKQGVDLFLSDAEYNSYNKISEDRVVIISMSPVSYKDDKIYIDAGNVGKFGDMRDVYNDVLCELKGRLEKK